MRHRAASKAIPGMGQRMSALGQKRTYALQQAMSALHPIATAKADMRKRSCPLCPQADMCSALAYVCFGPKEDTRTSSKTSNWSSMSGNVLSPVTFGVQSPRTQSGLSKRGQLRKG